MESDGTKGIEGRSQRRKYYENSPILSDITMKLTPEQILARHNPVNIVNMLSYAQEQIVGLEDRVLDLQGTAQTDHLTKLPNRRKFDYELARAVNGAEKSSQNNSDPKFSLLIIDADHFKNINDKYGHQAGDYVLTTLADILNKTCPIEKGYLPARIGGEEFAVIAPLFVETPYSWSGAKSLTTGQTLAESLRKSIKEAEFVYKDDSNKEHNIPTTVSIGVTGYDKGGYEFVHPIKQEKVTQLPDTLKSIFRRADEAMYSSKQNGRDKVTYFRKDSDTFFMPKSEEEMVPEFVKNIFKTIHKLRSITKR